MTTYTLFNQAQTGEYNFDTNAYTLTVEFNVNQSNLQLTGLWWYSAPTMTILPSTIALYTTSGTLVASNSSPSWLVSVGGGAASAGSGWCYAAFSSPVALVNGTKYWAAIFRGSGTPFYSVTRNYWTTGLGASGITNGPLNAPNQNSSVVGQSPFYAGSSLHAPNQQYQSGNYYVDVNVVTTAGTPPAVVTNAASSVTLSSATLNGTVNPESLATTYQFNYGTTTAYGTSTTPGSAGSGGSPVSENAPISGLLTNTVYHYQIQATNSAGTTFGADQTFTTLAAPLSITTTSLGNGVTGTAYSQTLTATGGITPYTWSISSGSLPGWAGLAASTGVISGTPNAIGTTSFTVEVTDAQSNTATQPLSITITNTLTITTGSLPAGVEFIPYNQTVTGAGGSAPYTWTISAGALPGWATLNSSTGVISGTPNALGTTSFTVKATDTLSATATQPYSITIFAPGSLFISNVVAGNVVNDYGLDNVPYTVATTGSSTMLAAYIGWDVAQYPYQSSGKAPAVNVTDSAGNLWRQVGISTMATSSRGALWVADNPRQTSWVSVALTGWSQSTAYMICELDNIPSTLNAVSLDFTKTVNSTAFTSSLSLAATASTTDIVLGLVTTGGSGGSLTVPSSWFGISSVGGVTPVDTTTYAMWIPSQSAGAIPVFNPTWANTVPSTGIIVGLKQTAAAPVQTNPTMPNVVVEAAFGATPGDWTQSVDYTWDVQGLTWTDISSRCFSKGDEATITVKRGRQYELSEEETGEIDIKLDNHDGAFTFGNTASPYYPNVIPGVPIRVSAWWQGTQYPVAFGYAEKWPQVWPDMPQWGFSTLTVVDAWGPMASVTLPSAVKGDVRKEIPYAYFTTQEQYEFTTQSLTPVASPLDANGLIAVNYAFGNNRYAAYRDGFDQPVTTGQALNLLGDEGTCLGATNYTGQEVGVNGPGMFYFDPNIPTNASSNGFAAEFWFTWGNTGAFECALLTAFGRPSSFFSAQATTAITNGAAIVVGVNTGIEYGSTIPTGFWVNGVEVTQGNFNQTSFAPQHFVMTAGPDGTQCYLNGVPTPASPVLPVIPQIKAVAMGPACFSYDVSGLAVYNGYNFVAGHLAWYSHELTATQIANHYETGFTGWAGTPAPGRFAQVLTWGQLGLKRGGTAWFGVYGQPEGTYISEAYSYDGSSAAEITAQIVQTEGGRAFTQGNGSIVYNYRWNLYNQNPVAIFGDNNTTELPFEQDTSFSFDNQLIYNVISATQNRGPSQDLFYQLGNSVSQTEYFMRSGLSYQNYAMTLFDVFDVVNWSSVKYAQPSQRVAQLDFYPSKIAGKFANAFPVALGTELNQIVTVNRRPVGGAVFTITGAVQQISHEIGAAFWHTTYQIAPVFPESQALIADNPASSSPGTQSLSW